ncbi:hypothetical protein [Flagellimonas lutimaris]|uniref:hypothetical protein n=1 Tax=Flagellimonas lutimaris TaxID=475082 RepID=UPI0039C390F2
MQGSLAQITDTGDEVGVGTSSPEEKLHVMGGGLLVEMQSDYYPDPRIVLNNDGVGANPFLTFYRWTGGSNTYYATRFYDSGNQGFKIQNSNTATFGNHTFSDAFTLLRNGDVGIGTSTPTSLLELRSNNNNRVRFNHSNEPSISFVPNNGNSHFHISHDMTNGLSISQGSQVGYRELLTIKNNGNVGIGTNNPIAALEINKNIDGSASAFILNQNSGSNARAIFLLGRESTGGKYGYLAHYGENYAGSWGDYTNSESTWLVGNDTNGLGIIAGNSQGKIFFGTGSSEKMRLTSNGFLGLGTKNPDAKLTVKGKIHAEEVKVDLTVPGPDYVFKEGYDLKSLEEVQNHIKEHGHLPNIPSAHEMEENGVQLGEMNMKLLEKIEELTLYTLQQQKEIKQYQVDMSHLNRKLEAMQQQINNLKN